MIRGLKSVSPSFPAFRSVALKVVVVLRLMRRFSSLRKRACHFAHGNQTGRLLSILKLLLNDSRFLRAVTSLNVRPLHHSRQSKIMILMCTLNQRSVTVSKTTPSRRRHEAVGVKFTQPNMGGGVATEHIHIAGVGVNSGEALSIDRMLIASSIVSRTHIVRRSGQVRRELSFLGDITVGDDFDCHQKGDFEHARNNRPRAINFRAPRNPWKSSWSLNRPRSSCFVGSLHHSSGRSGKGGKCANKCRPNIASSASLTYRTFPFLLTTSTPSL